MRLALLAMSITLLLSQSGTARDTTFVGGYQGMLWGMNRGEVRSVCEATHKVTDFQNLKTVPFYYMDTILGYQASVGPRFAGDSLFSVTLIFQISTVTDQTYTTAFSSLEEVLIKKYGKPERQIKARSDNQFLSDASALRVNDGIWDSMWKTEGTEVALTLMSASKGALMLSLSYQNPMLAQVVRDLQKKDAAGKL